MLEVDYNKAVGRGSGVVAADKNYTSSEKDRL